MQPKFLTRPFLENTTRLKTHKSLIEVANKIKSEYKLNVLEKGKEQIKQITVMLLSNTLIDTDYEIKIEGMGQNCNCNYARHVFISEHIIVSCRQ
jgi:phosphoribosylformylglycinamidine (FGAM) synthase PurS component